MEKVRLGIIGIGSMGTGHAGNVLKGMVPDMELTAVADIWQSRLDWARNNLPETVKVFDDGRKMIDSGSASGIRHLCIGAWTACDQRKTGRSLHETGTGDE